jgi:hypothetical protein
MESRRIFSATGTEVPATWFSILNSLFIVVFCTRYFLNGGKAIHLLDQ